MEIPNQINMSPLDVPPFKSCWQWRNQELMVMYRELQKSAWSSSLPFHHKKHFMKLRWNFHSISGNIYGTHALCDSQRQSSNRTNRESLPFIVQKGWGWKTKLPLQWPQADWSQWNPKAFSKCTNTRLTTLWRSRWHQFQFPSSNI